MRILLASLLAAPWAIAAATSTQGLYDLVKRRLPSHCEDFVFTLHNTTVPNSSSKLQNDEYSISPTSEGPIAIEGTSLSALATGLRRYLTDVAHVDIYWFIGSRLDEASSPLPKPNGTITGKSIVPWRYSFNTVTFSYTTPFWSWSDWELELDWLALHGVNLPLAWVGFEKILLDVFRTINLTDPEIISFFSGPAFQAWNRFGNIQGSWHGELPLQWINSQFELQQKILKRMLALGMTPILPAFTGFVPRALEQKFPDAMIVNGSTWEDFGEFTNTSFLEPADPLFAKLQEKVIGTQIQYYGNITSFYTLDQYNENDPFSGDLDYLRNVTYGTWKSIKSANPAAKWVMQGWLFYSNRDFWTEERIEAYLSGVEEDEDMLVLDLFSESEPQWQRTESYYGKPWIWNQLHNYGGNMGLYGQIDNVTINPVEALANSSNLVGFGLTPEGQEGNEIMYSLLLDQAWSSTPIDTAFYFQAFVRNRYAGANSIPDRLYTAWELLRRSAYNNTNLTSNAVVKAIYELAPSPAELTNRTGHHPTTLTYDPAIVVSAFESFLAASSEDEKLWENPSFQHDLVDVTRQVFANAFLADYNMLISSWNTTQPLNSTFHSQKLRTLATKLTDNLRALDTILSTLPQFSFTPWLVSARAQAANSPNSSAIADYYEYNARNQITLWGPNGEINDYASKSWGGLVGDYYLSRWDSFLGYLVDSDPRTYNATDGSVGAKEVEQKFQAVGSGLGVRDQWSSVREVVEDTVLPALVGLGVL